MKEFNPVPYDATAALKACISLREFAGWLRKSGTSSIPCNTTLDSAACFSACYDALYEIGRHASIPFGIAACMHLYMVASIAKFPLQAPELIARRNGFLELIRNKKLLVANSGSDSNQRSNNVQKSATRADCRHGHIVVTGTKTFVTLAQEADVLVFSAQDGESNKMLSLFTWLRDNPAVQLGAPSFGNFLTQSGTHSISFDQLALTPDNLIAGSGSDDAFQAAHLYQRSWFQGLVGAVYLGALSASMDYAVEFAKALKISAAATLAESDGFALDMGRLHVHLQAAEQLRYGVQTALAEVAAHPDDEKAFLRLARHASITKYVSTDTAEAASPMIRKLVGLRSFDPSSPVGRFASDVMFGQMHPELAPLFERSQGKAFIERSPSTGG